MTLDPLGQVLMIKRAGSVEGSNWYNYCNNNPIMNNDPTGGCVSNTVLGIVIGGVAGGIKSIAIQKGQNPDRKLDWGKVGTSVLIGVIKGGIVGAMADVTAFTIATGGVAGPLAVLAFSAGAAVEAAAVGYVLGLGGNLAEQKLYGKEVDLRTANKGVWIESVSAGVGVALSAVGAVAQVGAARSAYLAYMTQTQFQFANGVVARSPNIISKGHTATSALLTTMEMCTKVLGPTANLTSQVPSFLEDNSTNSVPGGSSGEGSNPKVKDGLFFSNDVPEPLREK